MTRPDVLAKTKLARSKQIFPKNDTGIELKMQDLLRQLGIEFKKHHSIAGIPHSYQCDIFIPDTRTVIECDGNYWHKHPFGLPIDHLRTAELRAAGYRVIRLWEHQIHMIKPKEVAELIARTQ